MPPSFTYYTLKNLEIKAKCRQKVEFSENVKIFFSSDSKDMPPGSLNFPRAFSVGYVSADYFSVVV